MFKSIYQALCLMLLMLGVAPTIASTATTIPPFTGYLVDTTQTLSRAQVNALTQKLVAFNDSGETGGAQIAILMINSTGNEDLNQYAVNVFERWQLGTKTKDNGLLILVALADRAVRIEVGYGLEGTMTDAFSGQLIRQTLMPAFREGAYAAGLEKATTQIIARIHGDETQSGTFSEESLLPDDRVVGYLGYTLISLIVLSLIFRRFKKRFPNNELRRLAVGGANTASSAGFLLLTGISDFSALFPLLFMTFVGSVIVLAILGAKRGQTTINQGRRTPIPRSSTTSSRSRRGGGFGGGRGGRSGGGGASGRW